MSCFLYLRSLFDSFTRLHSAYQLGDEAWNRRFKRNAPAVERMVEGEGPGMKRHAFEFPGPIPISVFAVPHDGVANIRQVYPYLVFSTRQQRNFQ